MSKSLRISQCVIAALFLLSPTLLFAGENETYDHINELAVSFVQQHIAVDPDEKLQVRVNESAQQLQIAKCDQPIEMTLPNGVTSQQISTIEMSCHGQQPWHVYVPIEMKILTKVVIAKQTIPNKEVISEDMLDYAEFDKNTLFTGYFKDTKEIVGQSPTTLLMPGTVITKKNVQQPILINRNQNVSIISRHGTIMVKAEGIAKSSGAYNETIRVLNPSSKRLVDAVVVSSSSVEVK